MEDLNMKLSNFCLDLFNSFNSKGLDIISQTATTIYPKKKKIYKHTLVNNDDLLIKTSELPSNRCVNFELWLTMPNSLVSFTFNSASNILWNFDNIFNTDNSTPSFDKANTLYVICFRFDGTNLLANLAYTKTL